MKKLYIFRGLPGSGKSTYAHRLAPLVIEPDMFRYNSSNEYVFRSEDNKSVLRKTHALFEYAIKQLKMPCLAIAATHVQLEHFRPYVVFGKVYGYRVYVIECQDNYQTIHNVPAATIKKMAKEFQPFSTELADTWGVTYQTVAGGRITNYVQAGSTPIDPFTHMHVHVTVDWDSDGAPVDEELHPVFTREELIQKNIIHEPVVTQDGQEEPSYLDSSAFLDWLSEYITDCTGFTHNGFTVNYTLKGESNEAGDTGSHRG